MNCACENISCRDAGHAIDERCKHEGFIEVDHVGRLCLPCAENMPTVYLSSSPYRVERLRRDRKNEKVQEAVNIAEQWAMETGGTLDYTKEDLDRVVGNYGEASEMAMWIVDSFGRIEEDAR